MRNKLKILLPIIAIVFFGIIASLSLFHKGLPPTHDGEYHVIRFYEFDKALRGGDLYPRWAPDLNNGYGVPLFNYVYPLPNYISSILHLLGINFIDAFKINLILATIMGSVFFYLWAKEFWGRLGGVVSSVFYTFSPYHFVDIYIRGSVGEVWALGFFPAFWWSYAKFVKSKQKQFLALSSIFLALIIFSHNILALMFFVFSLSYMLLLICGEKDKKYLILNTLYLILLGLSLSSIFWLPAIYEAKYVAGLQIFDVASNFPQLYQLLIPSWGSGFSGGGLGNELSYQIGAANLLAIFLSAIVVIMQIRKKNNKLPYTIFFLICFILVFFLMLDVSLPLWKTIPLMNYFQFPWRFLSIEIIFASFLAGSVFSLNIKNKFINLFLAIFLIIIAFASTIGYAKPAYYMYRDDKYYISRPNFIDGTNSPGNVFKTVYLKSIPPKEKERAIFVRGNGKITLDQARSSSYVFTVNAGVNSEIQANLAYFPGWEVYIDNKKTPLKLTSDGLFTFFVPKGINKVEIVFGDTLARKISTAISMASLILLFFLLINKRSVTIKQ